MNSSFSSFSENTEDKSEFASHLIYTCFSNLNEMTVIDNQVRGQAAQVSPLKQKRFREIQRQNTRSSIRFSNVSTKASYVDVLHYKAKNPVCNNQQCVSGLNSPKINRRTSEDLSAVAEDTKSFFDDYYSFLEKFRSLEHLDRIEDALMSISIRGFYELTADELVYGVKTAWRNDVTSLARVDWQELQVLDFRHVETAKEMFSALCEHISKSSNGGRIRPVASVFRESRRDEADFRIWNEKLISYAGYEQPDGSVIGDPSNVEFTQLCMRLGWTGTGSRFDILPVVLSTPTEDPQWFSLPSDLVDCVKLQHPDYPWFAALGLEWPALHSSSGQLLSIGGMKFPAMTLTHSHLGSDIGNQLMTIDGQGTVLKRVAEKLRLDTSVPLTLWQETALVELNLAILFSFQAENISISNHHTASRRFMEFFEEEQRMRGGCPSDWTKLVPKLLSTGITPIYHQEMVRYYITPNIEQQLPVWKTYQWLDQSKRPTSEGNSQRCLSFRTLARIVTWLVKPILNRVPVSVVYASETGRSESFAEKITAILSKVFRVQLIPMNEYDISLIGQREKMLIVVASTFGNGNAPENGKKFHRNVKELCTIDLNCNRSSDEIPIDYESVVKLKFAVFALGSTAYPDFCEFGSFCHLSLTTMGAQPIIPLTKADEVRGQEKIFNTWAAKIFGAACSAFDLGDQSSLLPSEINSASVWKPELYRLDSKVPTEEKLDLCKAMSKTHNRNIFSFNLSERECLLQSTTNRATFFLRLDQVNSSQEHEPGDHVAIYPSNPSSLVSSLIDRIQPEVDKHAIIRVQRRDSTDGEWHTIDRVPPSSAITAFTNFLDICAAPRQHFLSEISQFAFNKQEHDQIELLANDEEVYDNWKADACPNLLDFFTQFPSLKVDLTFLLLRLPLIQPRYYSISNSWNLTPNEIHLTVGLDFFRGGSRQGLCSSFLNELPIGEKVLGFIKKANHFHLPTNSTEPIIMVGSGTGLAPFRSFWQQREFQRKSSDEEFGNMTLYFGCRHPRIDYLYKDEIRQLNKDGVLSTVRNAFSRRSCMKKTYVQHLLQEDNVSLWQHLNKGGHVYVCGSTNMASEVRSVLQNVIETHGQMSESEANEFLLKLKDSEKLHEDIFGTAVTK